MLKKFREFIKQHKNINLILSGISLIYIWRGVWVLTDIFTYEYAEYLLINPGYNIFDYFVYVEFKFWAHLIPLAIAFTYIYINDHKFKELIHTD